ncbi:hypothetical protein RRF57_005937 [Xylaria bambusicola]|uniref:Uncharacterized protein n=1 Tax=Xylaria bambusicola TaxID=326684 RepID=A0AAN7UKG1_9PEZI
MATCRRLKRLTLYVSIWASLSYWVSGNGYDELSQLEMGPICLSSGSSYEEDCREYERNSRSGLARRSPPIYVNFNLKFSLRLRSSLITRHKKAAIRKRSTATEVIKFGAYIEAYCLLQKEREDPGFLTSNGDEFLETVQKEYNLSPTVNVAVIDLGFILTLSNATRLAAPLSYHPSQERACGGSPISASITAEHNGVNYKSLSECDKSVILTKSLAK